MKRPLLLLLIGLVLGELCGYWLYLTGVVIWASLLCIVLLYRRTFLKGKLFFILLAFFSMALLGNLSWHLEATKITAAKVFAEKNSSEEYKLEGQLTDCKITEKGYLSLTVLNPRVKKGEKEVFRLKGRCLCGGMIGNSVEEGEIPCPGDRVFLSVRLSFPQEARNPGGFPERVYDLANGICLKGDFSRLPAVRRPMISLRRYAYRIKCRMETGYMRYLKPEDSGVLCAMVLGDKTNMDYVQRKLYEENGVVHLLAISGLHISGVGGRIYRSLRRKGFSYSFSCICGGMLLLFYGCMTGFGSSVVRASGMFLIFLASEYLGRPYDLMSAMSLTGILMILEHPYRILEPGFQISYAAVSAIGWIFPFVKSCMNMEEETGKKTKSVSLTGILKEKLLGSLVIFTVTAPLVMHTYYECSPYSILLNPLILPAMSILMLSALLSGILGLLSTAGSRMLIMLSGHSAFLFLWRILALPSVFILHGYREIFTLVRTWKGALIITGCPSPFKMFLLYLYELLILFLLYRYRNSIQRFKKVRRIVLGFCCLFWITIYAPSEGLFGKPVCRITMLDVGQGESILVRLPGRKAMLIDGGSESREDVFEKVIHPAFSYYGISGLDYVLITHMDEDHISGIRQMLLSGYPVTRLLTGSTCYRDGIAPDPAQELICQLCVKNHTVFHTMERGDELITGGIHFLCLHPRKDTVYTDRNEKSLTMYIRWKDFSAVFPGDLGSEQEDNILEGINQTITLLKVGHHGSRYSTGNALLDRLKPSFAMISAGDGNHYGHPHREVLDRLKNHGTKVFQTKGNGAVCLDTDGENLRIYYWNRRRENP